MITKEKYNEISINKDYCSFLLWPESNQLYNADFFNPDLNKSLLNDINLNIILVGLNATSVSENYKAFHIDYFKDDHGKVHGKNDKKIKYAFKDNEYVKGAYVTDAIKGYIDTNSSKVISKLKKDKALLEYHKNKLLEEINLVNIDAIIIAIGKSQTSEVLDLMGIKHYSMTHFASHNFNNYDDYKNQINKELKEIINSINK